MKLRKMDETVKTEWVEALRSGQYAQGHFQLHHMSNEGHKYCCLGVLQALRGTRKWGGNELLEEACGIDIPVQKFLAACNDGVEDEQVRLQEKLELHYRPQVGKGAVANFAQIADWVEENL